MFRLGRCHNGHNLLRTCNLPVTDVLIVIFCFLFIGLFITTFSYSQDATQITKWGGYGQDYGRFNRPNGIAITPSGSNILVADTGNNRIQVLSQNGTFISVWGGYGSDNGRFNQPSAIAITPSGNILVADTGNNRIQVLSQNGTFISKWGGYGRADNQFRLPTDIAITPSGNILVADTGNNRIQVLSQNGTFISKWGGYGNDNGRFNQPNAIAVSPSGNVVVADTGNNRIQMLSQNGTFISKWGGYGKADNQLRSPTDVAITPSDRIVVVDKTNNRIVRYDFEYSIEQLQQNKNTPDNITINSSKLLVQEIASDFDFPTAIAFLGPKDFIVLERMSGLVKRVVDGKILDEPLLNMSDQKIGSCMCGIDIAKIDHTTYVFIYIAELQTEDGKIADRLYRYELEDNTNRLVNSKILLDIPISSLSGMHHGGKVLLGPDGNVYVIIGDIDGRDTTAQNVVAGPEPDGSSSILRMTMDGQAVHDNHTLGVTAPLNMYYGYGIRNSFGFDFDPVTNGLWFTDNGASTDDEINFAEPGFNGGWNKVMGFSSLKKSFDTNNLVTFEGKGKYTNPQFEWVDTVGPTALTFLDSDALGKEYQNNLFVSDFEHGYIYHFELNDTRTGLSLLGPLSDRIANNSQEADRLVFIRGMGGITDMKVSPDGLLYIVSALGKIYAIMPNGEPSETSR